MSREIHVRFREGVRVRFPCATRLILMAKKLKPQAIEYLKGMLARMKLTLNEEKTRLVDAKTESFNFLGFTFENAPSNYGRDRKYLRITPSAKALNKVRESIRDYMGNSGHLGPEEFVMGMNAIVRGWTNYFTIRGVSNPWESYRKLRFYLDEKLTRYFRRKSQRRCKLSNQRVFEVLVKRYGLIDPTQIAWR